MKVIKLQSGTFQVETDTGICIGMINAHPRRKTFGLCMFGWYRMKTGWNPYRGLTRMWCESLHGAIAEAEMLALWDEL